MTITLKHWLGLAAATAIAGCTRGPAHPCATDIQCGVGWSCIDRFCEPTPAQDAGPGAADARDATTGEPEVSAPEVIDRSSPWNYMFVTSNPVVPRFPSLTVADGLCDEAAAAGGLPGSYRAWLSTTTVDARDRLQDARGWIRPDGEPFADTVDDIAAGRIFNPPFVNELGRRQPPANTEGVVVTGTDEFGKLAVDQNCDDWTRQGTAAAGDMRGTTVLWTYPRTANCLTAYPLYCFGVDKSAAVAPTPAPGKAAFLSHAPFTSGGGIAAADALCAGEATAAGVSGRFKAALATSTASVAGRFAAAAPGTVWVRLDGIRLNAPGGDLFAGGGAIAPLNVTSQRAYTYEGLAVGSRAPRAVPDPTQTCQDWQSTSASLETPGAVSSMTNGLSAPDSMNCNFAFPHIYCLED